MYNEISLSRARARSQLNRASTTTNPTLAGLLQNTDKQAIVAANKMAMSRLKSTTDDLIINTEDTYLDVEPVEEEREEDNQT